MTNTILIIDDNEELRENASDVLMIEGFDVLQASDGLEGLQIARDTIPDLIICDINMPELDGYGVIQELRSESLTATIPFIFLSANKEDRAIRTGMNLGADDYLTKPFSNRDLLNAIRSRLTRSAVYELNQVRNFAHQIVKMQEAERKNFSLELKEHLSDILSDLKISLQLMDRLPPEARKTNMQSTQDLINQLLRQVEYLSQTYYPTTLQHLGLTLALHILIEQYRDQTSCEIQFESHNIDAITDEEMAIAIYRIVQEGLSNIQHHAQAETAEVLLWVENDRLRLQIMDDGEGFDLDESLQDASNIGIIGMRERAFLLNGELTILTAAGEGTQIIAEFPLDAVPSSEPILTDRVNTSMPTSQPMSSQKVVRIGIVESNEIMRWGIANAINRKDSYQVVGQVETATGMFNLLEDTEIDLLIVSNTLLQSDDDVSIPQVVEAVSPTCKIVLLSNFVEYTFANQAMKDGVSAYLLRTSSLDEIMDALDAVLSGQQYVAEDVMATMPQYRNQHETNLELDAFSTLTEREREVFYLVVNGNTNREIAEKLVISTRTAETHRRNMMRKLGIRGTQNLVHFAIGRGLIGQ